MTTYNGHNATLVNGINEAIANPVTLTLLITAMYDLATEYADEVYEKVLNCEEDEPGLLDRMSPTDFYDAVGEEFLTNVCDDADLITLLLACGHYPSQPKQTTKTIRITLNVDVEIIITE